MKPTRVCVSVAVSLGLTAAGWCVASAPSTAAAAPGASVRAPLPAIETLAADAGFPTLDGGGFESSGFARGGYSLECETLYHQQEACTWHSPGGTSQRLSLPGSGEVDPDDLLFPPDMHGLIAQRGNEVAAMDRDGNVLSSFLIGTGPEGRQDFPHAAFAPDALLLRQESDPGRPGAVFQLSLDRLFDARGWLEAPLCGEKQQEAYPIPRATLAPAVREGWAKYRSLLVRSPCLARATYATHLRVPPHASLGAMLVSERELWAEVSRNLHSTERVASKPKSWATVPHLEIWATPKDRPCDRAALVQWGIALSDGEVHAGFGAPKQRPIVERVQWLERSSGDEGTRFRVQLPFVPGGLTVTFVEGDGRTQRQLISTSRVVYGEPASLGRVVDIAGGPGPTCVPGKDGLVPAEGTLVPRLLIAR